MRTRVVILSGHSLFAEGVASRLGSHEDQLDLKTIDLDTEDLLAKIIALRPEAVIIDALSEQVQEKIRLTKLVKALPELTVIQLDPQDSQVQVMTSKGHTLGEVSDLIDLIQRS